MSQPHPEAKIIETSSDVPISPHGVVKGSGPLKMAVGAMGVVFGDIGTSPLYAMRDTFAGHHRLPLDGMHVFGIVSLMFWSMMIIVTLKYVTVI
ncbi:MAG: KUP/HAK/KT family potassium transporter, partial [Novosphingobium sp.]